MSERPPLFAVRFRFALEDAAVAGGAPGDPNARVSLPYVPGSALRGVAARAFVKGGGPFDADDEEARALLFSGAVRYLNAYPVAEPGAGAAARALPVPRSWVTETPVPGGLAPETIVDAADGDLDDDTLYDPVPGPFFVDGGRVQAHAPARDGVVRTQRSRRLRRATRDEGAVFFVDRLARGTVLEAAVVADTADLARRAAALIGGGMGVGRGKARAAVEWLDAEPVAVASGEDRGFAEGASDLRAGRHVVTLLSDAVVVGPHGEPEASARALGAALADALDIADGGVSVVSAFLAPTEVGGSNAHFGLPLERRTALAMGSVLVVETPSVGRGVLARALASGLGEGTEVGLGRFAVGLRSGAALGERAPAFIEAEDPPDFSEEGADVASGALARALVDRVVERRLAGPVRGLAGRWLNDREGFKGLTPTQLNGLRAAVGEARAAGSAAPLESHLDGLSPTQTRHYRDLAGWIRCRLEEARSADGARAAVFDRLGVSALARGLRVGGLGPEFDDAVALRATLDALAMALTQSPHRRRDD